VNVRLVKGWQGTAASLGSRVVIAFLLISMVGALMEQQGGGAAGRMGQNKEPAVAESSDKRFSDVMGCDEAKAELEEIVAYLKNPDAFTRLGGKLPSGLLLMGPPGTGKTLLARAIAGEAGVPFFFASGSEFEEMYVGVGARRMRDLFEAAKKRSPCIIFIDEIDAVGSSRQLKEQQAMKMTLNQLLVEMDGFEQNQGVIVIGATNYADVLDDALLRPGRFDKHVTVPLPDVKGRQQVLELYGSKVPLAKDVNLATLARGTPGMSGAELFNLMNQAALRASVQGALAVDMAALEYSKDKILMGAERKSAVISVEGARLTAYHEGGHALVAMHTVGADPVHKATIMPRGHALGMVMQLPSQDQTSFSRRQMLARLDVCMGGRVAEELVFGAEEVTSGASSDIQAATSLAKAMVTQWGMSDAVGVVFVDKKDASVSAEQRALIDKEVQALLAASYARATKLLQTHRKELDVVAKALVEKETLTGADLTALLAGRTLAK
jgi:ATP-dependent metalloprotease